MRAAGDRQLRSAPAGDSHPQKVIKGGSHLCAPNYCRRTGRRAVPRTDRHFHPPPRLPLYRASGEAGSRVAESLTPQARLGRRRRVPVSHPDGSTSTQESIYSGRMSIRKWSDRYHAAHLQGRRPPDPSNADLRSRARAGDCPGHRAGLRGRPDRRPRFAVPGPPASGGTRLHRRRVGDLREKP